MVFLETERLYLRNTMSGDAAVMFDYRNNERCSHYQRGQTKDYAQIAELVERRAHDTLSAEAPCMLAVARKETNEMIGEIVVVPKDNTISLGYTFSYQYHRHGYAFEALSALIDLLHQKAPDREFVCFTDPQNAAETGLSGSGLCSVHGIPGIWKMDKKERGRKNRGVQPDALKTSLKI